MNILVLQHMATEHPAYLGEIMARRGVACTTVRLDAGGTIPALDGFNAMLVMGGAMNVWQEDAHPWLVAEKAAIRRWVGDMARPYFGVCLGHQLLAAALGGEVGRATRPETGIVAAELLPAAAADPLLGGVSSPVATMHWHGAEVTRLPDGAVPLARSADCAVQAMRIGVHAWGFQYHAEVTSETVAEWMTQPGFAEALIAGNGPGAAAAFDTEAVGSMPGFHRDAEHVFGRFLDLARDGRLAGRRGSRQAAGRPSTHPARP
ncbi:MAG: synthase-Glutamine amidotransferase domain [Sphingomonas bacterium]|uniref:type 1 glutamine amidotransferase n=1 Tax=Sphingomonas bacterium TaxID=1895847 RepID=UPI00260F1228|nr:type 1 glutamine amidotransferase [Sphingomonas bacterium]MDB5708633.1 synthase-Glutamine amidotransferase domain [Sphingomonas bacterium]